MNKLPADGQAQPCTAIFSGNAGIRLHVFSKNLFEFSIVNTDTGVGNGNTELIITMRIRIDINIQWDIAFFREFDGIA